MHHIDFSPFYRSTVGFDRLFTMLDNLGQPEQVTSYPPYNIERSSEDNYTITMAVAGFSEEDIDIQANENTLTIRGEKKASEEQDKPSYLYRGIATRAFKRHFQLADHVQVQNASLKNGLLYIDLLRDIPENKKLRKIEITNTEPVTAKQIESA